MSAVPQNVQASVARTAAGPDTVTLTWVDSAATATSFTVQRATNTAFTSNLTNYTVTGATTLTNSVNHGQTYYYRVQAVNILGTSGWSASASVGTVPAMPTNLRMECEDQDVHPAALERHLQQRDRLPDPAPQGRRRDLEQRHDPLGRTPRGTTTPAAPGTRPTCTACAAASGQKLSVDRHARQGEHGAVRETAE